MVCKACFIYGHNHNDTLRGGTGDDYLHGGNNDDQLFGDAGRDELFGAAHNDSLLGILQILGPLEIKEHGMIQFHELQDFLQHAIELYRKCVQLIGIAQSNYEFDALVLAARSNLVPRRNSIVDPETGYEIHCHIHGNGYTIEDKVSRKVCRFSARTIDGISRLTFTSWDFSQFLGEGYNLDLVESELSKISKTCESLTHFKEGYTSYFIWEGTLHI